MGVEKYIPADLMKLYEVYDHMHAAAILANEFPDEFADLCHALREFRFTEKQVKTPGGNESEIPKAFSRLLRPRWKTENLKAELRIDDKPVPLQSHKIDYLRGRVALDLEWNSKDQTFDRDLNAFSEFHRYGKISVGVLVTRSQELDPWFASLGAYVDSRGKKMKYSAKYGASTTQMGQLERRLTAGRGGVCPVLIFGITTKLLEKR